MGTKLCTVYYAGNCKALKKVCQEGKIKKKYLTKKLEEYKLNKEVNFMKNNTEELLAVIIILLCAFLIINIFLIKGLGDIEMELRIIKFHISK